MKKKEIRDLIYVSKSQREANCFYSYGIEFYEFMNGVLDRPENLILLKHDFHNENWNQHSGFGYVTKEEINELIEDNIYRYGDFVWVDFSKEEDLNTLSSNDIAELLFFSHLARPLTRIPKIRFAYHAHDDGWFNKLYVTDLQDYEILLANVIPSKLRKLTGRKMNDIPKDVASALLEFTRDGLFIDLSRLIKSRAELKVPITTISHFTDMDEVYNFRKEVRDYKLWLVYSQKLWKLIKEE
jgi:uncharacterized LabA/DUF88 family protein